MMLKNLQITTDVTLVVKDGILIEAHKLVLGAVNTFSNDFRNAKQSITIFCSLLGQIE